MNRFACKKIDTIAQRLIARYGLEICARLDRKIIRARDARLWNTVNLWCRVKWRVHFLERYRGGRPKTWGLAGLIRTNRQLQTYI